MQVVATGDLGQELQISGPLVQCLARFLVDFGSYPRRPDSSNAWPRIWLRYVGGPPGPRRLHADAVQEVTPIRPVDLEPRARTPDRRLAPVLDDRAAHEAGQGVASLDDHGHDGIDRKAVVVGVTQPPVLEVV